MLFFNGKANNLHFGQDVEGQTFCGWDCLDYDIVKREEAIELYGSEYNRFIHFGRSEDIPDDVPLDVRYSHYAYSSIASDHREKAVRVSALASGSKEYGESPVGLWIADTGCGNDLLSRDDAASSVVKMAQEIMTFRTANGKTEAKECAEAYIRCLKQNVCLLYTSDAADE